MSALDGLVIKGIAGFYYVKSGDEVYRCKARGIFKQKDIKITVGDRVAIEVLAGDDNSWITELYPRENVFIRPFVSNVDCFVIVTSILEPDPNFLVINKFMAMAENANTKIVLCVNKCDLINDSNKKAIKAKKNLIDLKEIYTNLYPIIYMGMNEDNDIENFKTLLGGNKAALAGPSGVGKSTILNRLIKEASAKTGSISHKLGRGRHTTRHSELFILDEKTNTMIFDTPGFTSFSIINYDEEELQGLYPEISSASRECKYSNCRHLSEPGCNVINLVKEGKIHQTRYDSYKTQLKEIRKNKEY